MEKITDKRVIIVKRTTRLDELIARFNTVSQAKFYVEHLGADFSDYEDEHRNYYRSLEQVKKGISEIARFHVLDRVYLPNFIFAEDDILVIVGQDGLVANTLKYLKGQMALGVNPDRGRWDGILLPFTPDKVSEAARDVAHGVRSFRSVTLGKVTLQNGQELLAVNDFFIGQRTHKSARYVINYAGVTEQQSSSGIIISTGLGSSGWLQSVVAGARGVVSGGFDQENADVSPAFPWEEERLVFSVREPFPSRTTGTGIVFGSISERDPFSVVSQMGENGVIFSDGIENDFIEFNSGMEARISIAGFKGRIVV